MMRIVRLSLFASLIVLVGLDPISVSWTQAAAPRAPASATVTYTDGDFSTGWTETSVVTDDPRYPGLVGPGTSTGSITLQSSGGNPGSFQLHTHNVVYGDFIYTVGLNSNAIYDPGTLGAISSINFSIDLLEDPTVCCYSAWQFVLKQGGILYYSIPWGVFSKQQWQSYKLFNLTAQDFDTNPNAGSFGVPPNGEHPDFSERGAPITFGYDLGNDLLGPGTLTLRHGADNWLVTVIPVHIYYLPLIQK